MLRRGCKGEFISLSNASGYNTSYIILLFQQPDDKLKRFVPIVGTFKGLYVVFLYLRRYIQFLIDAYGVGVFFILIYEQLYMVNR